MRQLKITNRITTREDLALDKYLNDISKIELLAESEEAELASRIREGDQEAMDRLIQANLRFVVSVAKQYQNNGLSLSDLINEGNVGLMKAARRFDETKGFKFISYAVWWIRQSILQAIVEYSRIVRMPMNKSISYKKLKETRVSFMQEFEREPSVGELAEILDITEDAVRSLLHRTTRHKSFDAPVSNDDGDAVMIDLFQQVDEIPPDSKLMEESLQDEIKLGLAHLSPREVEVLKSYFGLNGSQALNLEEIGDLYGLTRERVRQIKERALRRLRKTMVRNSRRSFGF